MYKIIQLHMTQISIPSHQYKTLLQGLARSFVLNNIMYHCKKYVHLLITELLFKLTFSQKEGKFEDFF